MTQNCYIKPYEYLTVDYPKYRLFDERLSPKNTYQYATYFSDPHLKWDETPTKTAYFVKTIFDKPNGFVDIEFVVAGYEKTEINVEFSHKEKTLFVRNSQNETLCTYLFDDNLTQDVDFSQNPTSTLKNGILKVSFKLKQEQKDIKITIN